MLIKIKYFVIFVAEQEGTICRKLGGAGLIENKNRESSKGL